ncbi:MAG: LysR family transcriptional regulator [Ruthenibacterium sp.]
MNLQQLKYAVEIARVGSISKAAKNLYMGQPNLSKSIKELEAELGQTLFSRRRAGCSPPAPGKIFWVMRAASSRR